MSKFKIKKIISRKNIPLLFNDHKRGYGNVLFDIALFILIFLSSLLFILETYITNIPVLRDIYILDGLIMIAFSVEVVLRTAFATRRISYFFSLHNIIDLLAIIPFWVGLPSLQFLRVFRILKMHRYMDRYTEGHPSQLKARRAAILFKMVTMLLVLVYISSAVLFMVENPYNDKINSFGDAAYLSVVSVTTVGYGDVYPVTPQGRIAIVVTILCGVFLIPMYIGSLFRLYIRSANKRHVKCKKCGLMYHDYNAVHCKMCGDNIYQEFDDNVL